LELSIYDKNAEKAQPKEIYNAHANRPAKREMLSVGISVKRRERIQRLINGGT